MTFFDTTDGAVTIVTQTRVYDDSTASFAAFQARISAAVSQQPGFIEQSVLPPDPPTQVDWVILQRFTSRSDAVAWLRSERRRALLLEVQSALTGHDDIHIVRDSASGDLPSPVSAVIVMRVKPGQESNFKRWERRLASAQARYPGFDGYRLEPPIPGVQDSYVSILRFDTEEHLHGWLRSVERQDLLREAEPLTADVHERLVRTGFSQWFASQQQVPRWKQNMVVVSLLYPIVFLFGFLIQAPILTGELKLPYWFALFIGNIVSVIALSYLVPLVSRRTRWWLEATPEHGSGKDLLGVVIVSIFCFISFVIFSQL